MTPALLIAILGLLGLGIVHDHRMSKIEKRVEELSSFRAAVDRDSLTVYCRTIYIEDKEFLAPHNKVMRITIVAAP